MHVKAAITSRDAACCFFFNGHNVYYVKCNEQWKAPVLGGAWGPHSSLDREDLGSRQATERRLHPHCDPASQRGLAIVIVQATLEGRADEISASPAGCLRPFRRSRRPVWSRAVTSALPCVTRVRARST